MIDSGDLSDKPGWVRVSLHPTMTDGEARYVGASICGVVRNYREWSGDYTFHKDSGEFFARAPKSAESNLLARFRP